MQVKTPPPAAAAAAAAAAVVSEVAASVNTKGVTAADASNSFVAIDENRRGLVDDDGLPLVYDRDAIQKYWDSQGGALQQRWAEFLGVSVPFLTRVAGLLISGGSEALQASAGELAKDARVGIEKLGPTYVKMGQMMSVRPDILPQEALDELQVLQDGVEGFSTEIARQMIERELGRPLDDVFVDFSDEPAAAASLAQVYRAQLRETGEWVAVKVQRPSVQELVSKDLYVLRRAAEVYDGLVRRFAPQQRTDYVALLNEWAVGFYTELDFENEAANMKRMASLLADAGVEDVIVPRVYDHLTSRRLLVSEWIDGRKLSDCEPGEVKDLIKVGQECFLVQLLQSGFFHSDPHPGNLIRLNDQSRAKLALIDFGLVATLGQDDMDGIISAIIHLANKDYAALVDDFIALEILPADCDRAKVIPLMDKALSPYVKGGGAKKYEDELKKLYGMDGSVESTVGGFQAMTNDMLTVLNDIPFSIPPYFALLARAVVTLEGLALSANPDYGLVLEAYPFVARRLLASDRPEMQQALQEVLYGGGGGLRGVVTPTRLASLLNSAAGIVARQEGAAFVDLDAVPDEGLSVGAALSFLLQPQAAAVRALLEDEALGAADLLLRQGLRKTVPVVAAALPRPPRVPFLPPPPDALDLPIPLPAALLGGAVGGGGGSLLAPPVLTNARELVEAAAPSLTREEELYQIALVDLVKGAAGDDAAALVAGDVATEPLAAVRALLPLIRAAAGSSSASGDGLTAAVAAPAVQQLAQNFERLLNSLPGAAPQAALAAEASTLQDTLAALEPAERETLQGVVDRLASRLTERLEERLASLAASS